MSVVMDEPTKAPRASTTVACPACGHDHLRDGVRLDTYLGPLLIPLVLAAPIALYAAPPPWTWLPLTAAALLLALRTFGGIYYWGGWKCRRCGHTVMER